MIGSSFPLFAPRLFSVLGIAWGNALVASIVFVNRLVLPVAMWRWGVWPRIKSLYCAR
ncbi:hypothetical protein LY78DRAFT_593675 [Colletotrichum sublineola]|nr:hypothetical protein LY78DRAFT_593675 [Colletotrichum sublineola]